jgi:hypothetical protein
MASLPPGAWCDDGLAEDACRLETTGGRRREWSERPTTTQPPGRTVAGMTTTHIHPPRSPVAIAALGAVAVTAVSFLVEISPGQDVTFPLFMLAGPLLTGVVLGSRWRLGAAAWSIAALVWLVLDYAINHEDVAFHAVVAVMFALLVAAGAGLAKLASRSRGSAR